MRRVLMLPNTLPDHARVELEDRVLLESRPSRYLPDREGKLLFILIVEIKGLDALCVVCGWNRGIIRISRW